MPKTALFIFAVLFLASCDYFKQESPRKPIARVNDSYLYFDDIEGLVSENTSKEDSILLVENYINRWATQQLLIDQAKINLNDNKLKEFDKLVHQYQVDLYTEAYKNNVVSQQLDSVITENELAEYYQSNKENFKLKDDLLKIRYVQVSENFTNIQSISDKLRRFNKEDKEELSELSIQFKASNFNDSTWIKREKLFKSLAIVEENRQRVLKKSNFVKLQDSLGVYLIKIEDLLGQNDTAPLEYVKPVIEQIILNKRKLELIKKLEKDITKDAITNKKFETFTYQ